MSRLLTQLEATLECTNGAWMPSWLAGNNDQIDNGLRLLLEKETNPVNNTSWS